MHFAKRESTPSRSGIQALTKQVVTQITSRQITSRSANAEVLKRLAVIDKTLLKHDKPLQIIWQQLQPLLPANTPCVFTYGQMKEAQAIALQPLLNPTNPMNPSQQVTLRMAEGAFTD